MISIQQGVTVLYNVYEYTFSESVMGESTISLTLYVEPTKVETFGTDYFVTYAGNKYYLKTKLPTGQKSTDSLMYEYTLVFTDVSYQLRRRIVRDLATTADDTLVSKGTAFQLYGNFNTYKQLLEKNLTYSVGAAWAIDVKTGTPNINSVMMDINNLYIWDLLLKSYEYFGVRWTIELVDDINTIKFGYDTTNILHTFKYKDGLSKIVRSAEADASFNRISGTGGTRNIPINYFSNRNTNYPADPNPIDSGVIIRNLMPSVFRDSVIAIDNPYKDYVQDNALIAIDGIKETSLEVNEEIYPSIENYTSETLGRLDKIVAAEIPTIDIPADVELIAPVNLTAYNIRGIANDDVLESEVFTVDDGVISAKINLSYEDYFKNTAMPNGSLRITDPETGNLVTINGTPGFRAVVGVYTSVGNTYVTEWTDTVLQTGTQISLEVPNGSYYLRLEIFLYGDVYTVLPSYITWKITGNVYNIEKINTDRDLIFDIWVKDLGFNLADNQYTTSEEAKVAFKTGMLAGQEYTILATSEVRQVVVDTTKTYETIPSKYRITLIKSDAEVETSGYLLPNTRVYALPGDQFVILGINMPQVYVDYAEERLTDYLTKQLNAVKNEKQSYTIEPDTIFIEKYERLDGEELVNTEEDGKTIKEKLRAGNGITIQDDKLLPSAETLYINSVTIDYKDSILPDYTVTVSNKLTVNGNAVERLQSQIDVLSDAATFYNRNLSADLKAMDVVLREMTELRDSITEKYLSKEYADTAAGKITLQNGLIAEALSKFTHGLEIGQFASGFLGAGASLKMTPDGMSELEVDKLTVRMAATFFELIIRKISHVGGELILSPARMKCTNVIEETGGYKCYFNNDEGAIANEFEVNDQARCQVYTGSGVKSYWRLVTAKGADYITLSKTDCAGTGIPAIGDDIIQLGNRTVTGRQNAQILSTLGYDAPSYKQYKGIGSGATPYSLAGKERTVLSASGNTIVGTLKVTNGNIDTPVEDYITASTLSIQYSATGGTAEEEWHNPPMLETDIYLRQKLGTVGWGAAVKFVGNNGTSVTIKDNVATNDDIDDITGMMVGDGYIVDATGHLWVYMANLQWKDVGRIQGDNGLSSYVHIKYSNDGGVTFTGNNGEDVGYYMGVRTDNTSADYPTVGGYVWSETKGEKGDPGAAATVYELVSSSYVSNKNISGVYTPSVLTFSGLKTIGNGTPTTFGGIYRIYRNGEIDYTSPTAEISANYTITAGTTSIKVELYLASVKVDETTIAITNDGTEGKNAISCTLSNGSHGVPCDKDGTPTSYASSGTKIYVTDGAAYLQRVTTITGNSQFTVAATSGGITVGAISTGTNCAVVANHSGMTTNPAMITYTIVARNSQGIENTYYLVQTLTKNVTGATGRAVVSIVEYYLATSASTGVTMATPNWSTGMQTPTAVNKYLWNYEVITWSSGVITTYVDPVIIGVYGVDGINGISISSVDIWYYKSSSNTDLVGDTWSTNVPTWSDGSYIWSKTRTTKSNASYTETSPVCITGGKGTTGKGIASIIEQYNLSTSKSAPTGTWEITPQTWSWGKYIWTRSKITYTDSSVSYTEQICDSSWEAVNEIQIGGENSITNGKQTLTAGANTWYYSLLFGSEAHTSASALSSIVADGTLTPTEKTTLKAEWDYIVYEKPRIDTQADIRKVSKIAYGTAYTNLSNYITPLLVNMGGNSSVTATTFNSLLSAYYSARQELLRASGTYLKNSTSYMFSVGSVVKTVGSPATSATLRIVNFMTGEAYVISELNIAPVKQFAQITTPATGDWSVLLYAGTAGSTANNILTFDHLMLQEGNKETFWKPSTQYITDALRPTTYTETVGGLHMANIMAIKNAGGAVVGGMNGMETAANDIRLWFGKPIDQMEAAPFKVYEDGMIELSNESDMNKLSIKKEWLPSLPTLLAQNTTTKIVGYSEYNETTANGTYTVTDTTFYPKTAQQFTLTSDALVSVTAWLKGFYNDGGANTVLNWDDSEISGGIIFEKWNGSSWVNANIFPQDTKNVTYNVKYKLTAGTYRLKMVCTVTLPESHSVVKAQTTCVEMTYTYAVNKTYVATDGICAIEDSRKYLYLSLNDIGYVMRTKGNVKLTSPSGYYQLVIDDTGIYKVVNGAITYL